MAPLRSRIFMLAVLAGISPTAFPQTPPAESRGQLLYSTHCISCHTSQVHWRDDKIAQDWNSLKAQVRRWQGNASLQWTEADITEVSRHLNDTIYHYPQTGDRVSLGRMRASP
jgi:hypothetical protein